MMPKFSNQSSNILMQAHPDLCRLMNEAIQYVDFKVMCSFRGEAEQNDAYHSGASNLQWPISLHNERPSRAVDIVPWHDNEPHIRYSDTQAFYLLAGVVLGIAKMRGIDIRWGGTWHQEIIYARPSFIDLPHWELA